MDENDSIRDSVKLEEESQDSGDSNGEEVQDEIPRSIDNNNSDGADHDFEMDESDIVHDEAETGLGDDHEKTGQDEASTMSRPTSQPKLVFELEDMPPSIASPVAAALSNTSPSTTKPQPELPKGSLVIEIENIPNISNVTSARAARPPMRQISFKKQSGRRKSRVTDVSSIGSSSGSELDILNVIYFVTAEDLAKLCGKRPRLALANVLEKGIEKSMTHTWEEETSSSRRQVYNDMSSLIYNIRNAENTDKLVDAKQAIKMDENAEKAANAITELILLSSPHDGIDPNEVEHRRDVFGRNEVSERDGKKKGLVTLCCFCWKAIQNFLLIMLIIFGIISIAIGINTLQNGENCETCWIEGAGILCSVFIIVTVSASIKYAKRKAFKKLSTKLRDSNTKAVIRGGNHCLVKYDEIVVGDILCVNSHSLISIPADCMLLGPDENLKVDQSSLTGDVKPIRKKPGDIVHSGTFAVEGSARMVVIAVGINSVAGKIRAGVYEHKSKNFGGQPEVDFFADETSSLFMKTDIFAQKVCLVGIVAAILTFYGLCIIGMAEEIDAKKIITYSIDAIVVLAVAMPEGLPLAVTLALASCSTQMMEEQSLVKHLDACESMGCTTTICTNKTGTLTSSKMTARACCCAMTSHIVDSSVKLSDYMARDKAGISPKIADLICRTIAIDTMDETALFFNNDTGEVTGFLGNPIEAALLTLVHDMGVDYDAIRKATKGRSVAGIMSEFLSAGKHFEFSSARKLMSWAVPLEDGGYRVYSKGAHDVILSRSVSYVTEDGTAVDFKDDACRAYFANAALSYTRGGMTCLGLAYRDLPADFDLESLSDTFQNSDGARAYTAETSLVLVALIGLENPLRPEIPNAIKQCQEAGIDVRLVTGDNYKTAFTTAYDAGILQDVHFQEGGRNIMNLKENVLLLGKDFRKRTYTIDENGKMQFNQQAFDRIWPHLRVLSQSSADDKLALAYGLNQSTLFTDYDACNDLKEEDGIHIFPDQQTVAMTGHGKTDAPALSKAKLGFAMGISGTQIAKDAADVVLMDDNFASIVTAVKCGRNLYASIQKFLQFQLSANISTVIIVLVGIFGYRSTPLAPIQLLWINLIIDSLGSIALASENPTDNLMQKAPVNKNQYLIVPRMWANIIGQATYQLSVGLILLFKGPQLLGIEEGYLVEDRGENSVHYTIIFNSFVWMQLFNEINSRFVDGQMNVFDGILDNPVFCSTFTVTALLQSLIVNYGSVFFHVADDGLETKFWLLSLNFGFGSIIIQQIINIVYATLTRQQNIRKGSMQKSF